MYFSHEVFEQCAGVPILLPLGSGGAEGSPCMEAGGAQGFQPA